MIKKVNPVAKAMLESRRRTQVVPSKKKYNRKKEKNYAESIREDTEQKETKPKAYPCPKTLTLVG